MHLKEKMLFWLLYLHLVDNWFSRVHANKTVHKEIEVGCIHIPHSWSKCLKVPIWEHSILEIVNYCIYCKWKWKLKMKLQNAKMQCKASQLASSNSNDHFILTHCYFYYIAMVIFENASAS